MVRPDNKASNVFDKRVAPVMENDTDNNVSQDTLSWSAPDGTIRSQNMDDLNPVPVTLASKLLCRGMLDTGAGVNWFEKQLVERIGLAPHIADAHGRMLKDAQGNVIKIFVPEFSYLNCLRVCIRLVIQY